MSLEYFTKNGVDTLNNRLKELTRLYVKGIDYPFDAQIYGFINLKIHSKLHHEGMIDELAQILGHKEVKLEIDNGN